MPHDPASPFPEGTITAHLASLERGDTSARDALWESVYEELRRMAGSMMQREQSNHTLQPTALVHEAYARLLGGAAVRQQSRAYFFGAAAQAMRRILIEHARRNSYGKGTGGETLGPLKNLAVGDGPMTPENVESLDRALDELKTHNPDVHDVVMLRFFAGLGVEETADALGISPRSVKRYWAYGRRGCTDGSRAMTTPEPAGDALTIFSDAIELPEADRSAFIERACAGDARLADEVRSLLRTSDAIESETFLAPEAGASDPETDRIGPYRLLTVLGEGGMGVVYLAEQIEPVRRRVALKRIKAGMDTREVINRFESERQALATLEHPGIARVLDGGVTDRGSPYFVMEYVGGPRITTYCDARRLGIEERLRVFVKICKAVEHAHANGIVHRDLKPSNILVGESDGEPAPKIIDFGIAKAVHQPLTDHTVQTLEGQLIGTPEYMSPEQASGSLEIDGRTDVYALGMVLYELLAGVLPFDREGFRKLPLDQMHRVIRETPAARVSVRAASHSAPDETAACRAMTERELSARLRGDLDWIIGRAIEKSPERRYPSPAAIASDIERHLSDRPVEAGPPSIVYRARKMVTRHRPAVIGLAIAGGALLVGLALAAYGWVAAASVAGAAMAAGFGLAIGGLRVASRERDRAVDARRLADRERAEAERQMRIAQGVNRFLNDDLLAAAAPEQLGRDVTMLEVLDVASRRVGDRFAGDPTVEASVRSTLGRTYHLLGETDPAARHLEAALELRRAAIGDEHPETADAMAALGSVWADREEFEAGESLLRRSLDIHRTKSGPEALATLETQRELAALLHRRGETSDAEPLYERAIDALRRTVGDEHPATLMTLNDLALLYRETDRLAAARPLYEEVLRVGTIVNGERHPDTLTRMNNLASLLYASGDYDAAAALHRETLDLRRHVLGPSHPQTTVSMSNLGGTLSELERFEEAEPLLAEAVRVGRSTLPPGHVRIGVYLWYYGRCLVRLGRFGEAVPVLRESHAVLTEKRGADAPWTVEVAGLLAEARDSDQAS